MPHPERSREIATLVTHGTLQYVRWYAGEQGAQRVIALSGLAHVADELEQEGAWIPYAETVALLDAAAAYFGDPRVPQEIGRHGAQFRSRANPRLFMRLLGTPEAAYRRVHKLAGRFSSIVRSDCLEARPGYARCRLRYDDGYQPSLSYDGLSRGLHEAVTTVFGLPLAKLREYPDPDGDPQTRFYELSWKSHSRLPFRRQREEIAALRLERDMLASSLDELRSVAADLVTPGEVNQVLAKISHRTAATVQAQWVVLTVCLPDENSWRTHGVGLGEAEAEQAAERLRAYELHNDHARLVTAIQSGEHIYGWLVAGRATHFGFHEGEPADLATCARLAATALDGAAALGQARRGERVARAMWWLADRLVATTSVGEVTEAVARAVPEISGAGTAGVWLWDAGERAGEGQMRLVATAGMPDDVAERVAGFTVRERETPHALDAFNVDGLVIYNYEELDDAVLLEGMERVGTQRLAMVPLTGKDGIVGAVTAGWHDREIRLPRDLEQRMLGLASQAATAVANAQLHDAVRHQALHDPLTGLANRRLFTDRVADALLREDGAGGKTGVVFIDLDDFKTINDSLGHDVGDQLLCEVARRMRTGLRPTDMPSRLSGDEFAVLLKDLDTAEDAASIAWAVRTALTESVSLAGRQVRISVSMGVATSSAASDVNTLLRNADAAMYAAKHAGKNSIQTFSQEMRGHTLRRLELATDLETAVSNDELWIAYQPIVALSDYAVVGVEALLRWTHPVHGDIPRGEFIAVAEDTGAIVPVGRWLLYAACHQVQAMNRNRRERPLTLSINVSARQIFLESFVDDVADALGQARLPAGLLTLELTERLPLEDLNKANNTLAALSQLGVNIAIDDFGTGYAGLSYLQHLRPNTVKLDASLLTDTGDPYREKLLHGILALARILDVTTTAEGVETAEQLATVEELGCDQAQGYYFGQPEPASSMTLRRSPQLGERGG